MVEIIQFEAATPTTTAMYTWKFKFAFKIEMILKLDEEEQKTFEILPPNVIFFFKLFFHIIFNYK